MMRECCGGMGIMMWVLMLQVPFYQGGAYNLEHFLFCALASVSDMMVVLLMYLGLALFYNNPLWIYYFKWQQIIVVMLIGAVGAILTEMKQISEGNWSYTGSMPIIPVIKVGLFPVLQFTILPTLILYISYYFFNTRNITRITKPLKKKMY